MKKTILSLLTLLTAITINAQEVSGLVLGYCDGLVTKGGAVSSTEKDAWNAAAIGIPAGDIKTYAGCHIDSIRVGLASKLNVDSLVVWLRTNLDGDNVAQAIIPKATLKRGEWMQVALDEAYTIPADLSNGLYIGYSYHQKGSCKAISVIPMSPDIPGSFYLKMNGEEWTDQSSLGALSIEALVFGNKLPKLNLQLKTLNVQDLFVIDKGTLKVDATVRNLATQTVTGFDFTTTIEGIGEVYTAHVDSVIAYNAEKQVSFTIQPAITTLEPSKRLITVTLSKLNEGTDENPDNNTLTDSIEVVNHDYTRAVLLEEFTTEQCSNCPRMAGYIKNVLASGKYDGRLNVICHHAGYYTDWLTTTFDSDYLWLFNGGTYAPAVMFDRDARGEATPVSCPTSQNIMEAYIDYRLAQPALVSLHITAEEDADDPTLLNVHVTGERSKANFTTTDPRICVTVVENDITARNQAGASNFVHEHVNRIINDTWGQELEWNGNSYDYSCTLKMRDLWEKKNLQIVAYIFGYDKDDATNCTVANSSAIDYPYTSTAISLVETKPQTGKTYYTLSGERISIDSLHPGIYIVKENGKTHKELVR